MVTHRKGLACSGPLKMLLLPDGHPTPFEEVTGAGVAEDIVSLLLGHASSQHHVLTPTDVDFSLC